MSKALEIISAAMIFALLYLSRAGIIREATHVFLWLFLSFDFNIFFYQSEINNLDFAFMNSEIARLYIRMHDFCKLMQGLYTIEHLQ